MIDKIVALVTLVQPEIPDTELTRTLTWIGAAIVAGVAIYTFIVLHKAKKEQRS